MSKTVVTSSGKAAGMLSRFTKKKATCIGCRAVLDRDGEAQILYWGGRGGEK